MAAPDERQPLLRNQSRIRSTIQATPVYPIVHIIRNDIITFIDTPLTYEALIGPDITYTLVRPLVDRYLSFQQDGNMSVVFCILLNRIHFNNDRDLATSAVSRTRSQLCEILAIQMLRDYGNDLMDLTLALTTNWPVYNGADRSLLQRAREDRGDDLEEFIGNAIELAIISKAKRFIKSSACQIVIDGIWSGKCVYTAHSSHSILSDTYKRNPIHFYDPHKAPLLDHYRLKVPSIRAVLEYSNFLILFVLFVFAIEMNERDQLNAAEVLFMVYGFGYCLEKIAAMQEHGIKVYFKGTWNGFDMAFVVNFLVYAFFRLYGMYNENKWAKTLGIDFLAVIACLMFPRLAFVTLKDSLMVLALRAMIVQFVILMLIASFCFCGFLYALWTLSRTKAHYSVGTISWWMVDLFFGLDATGFDRATTFHPTLGPILTVTYACLSNTLLVTVLVSILSNTFALISEDAPAEAMFRRAVSTIEGVKADFLFSYQPPVNMIALLIMFPARYMLSPRWFHKFNVFMIRLTNFPILLFVAWYERQAKKADTSNFTDTMAAVSEDIFDALPKSLKRFSIFEGLAGSKSNIDAIFEIEDEHGSALDTFEYPVCHIGDEPRPASSITEAAFTHDKSKDKDKDKDKDKATTSNAVPPPTSNTVAPPGPTPIQRHRQEQSQPGTRTRRSSKSPTLPRARVQSLFTRGVDLATQVGSPLAQVFQPLLADDMQGNQYVATPSRQLPIFPPIPDPHDNVSYGPMSRRRRLSSMARTQNGITRQASGGSLSRFAGALSGSPDVIAEEESSNGTADPEESMPHKASQVESTEFQTGGVPVHWGDRLDELEKRQDRMESLLKDILNAVKAKASDG